MPISVTPAQHPPRDEYDTADWWRARMRGGTALLLLAAVVVVTVAAYWPGLRGPFLFDDFGNLPTLGQFGPVDNPRTLLLYLTSGDADPTGRPLALLSFLIDARDWPADPFPFKRTNLAIHIANGLLLYRLLSILGGRLGRPPSVSRPAATFGAACWMLHPLLVSTTLYVVQREAQLCTSFVLLGLIAWASSTRAGASSQHVHYGGIAMLVCTAAATLSKANGILLPVLACVLDIGISSANGNARALRHWRIATRSLAAGVALALIVVGVRGVMAGVLPVRGWSVGQRLLTEPRVLTDYLWQLLVPRPYSSGVFNDDVVASTSLWSPASTLASVALVFALASGAWLSRRHAPALSMALLFFFAAHLLESTVIPLELYFEHRNYLAACLLFWPAGLWLVAERRVGTAVRSAVLFGVPVLLAALTAIRAQSWGDVEAQALLWARLNPGSPRAAALAASVEIDQGRADIAAARLRALLDGQPAQTQLALALLDAECALGRVTPRAVARTAVALRTSARLGRLEYDALSERIGDVRRGRCAGIALADVAGLVDAMAANRAAAAAGRRQDLLQLRGELALAQGRPGAARAAFTAALVADPRAEAGIAQAALLATYGARCDALAHLDRAAGIAGRRPRPGWSMRALHEWWLWRSGYWRDEVASLRRRIQDERPDVACRAR